jgi:hypothetical protein
MKDELEPQVLPPAASSPPFAEAGTKTTRLEGRLIVAQVGQDKCKRILGARRRTSAIDTTMPW